jgi:predicted permease
MLQALVLVLSLLTLGYLARRLGRYQDEAANALNRFVIDLCVPAVLLRVVPTLHFRWELLVMVLTPWLLALVGFAFVRLSSRLVKMDGHVQAALILCTTIGNTSFLGFPLCSALLGEQSLSYAAVYDQLGTFLLLSFIGPIVVARAAGGHRPPTRELLVRVLSFPPFVALLIALIPVPRPAWLDAVLAQVAAALVPVALFAVGLRLRITPPRELGAFALGLGFKLVLSPLLALAVLLLVNPPRTALEVAVLEAAMPSSVTAGAVLIATGLAPELAAALVGWGLVAALFTVPAWAALLRVIE